MHVAPIPPLPLTGSCHCKNTFQLQVSLLEDPLRLPVDYAKKTKYLCICTLSAPTTTVKYETKYSTLDKPPSLSVCTNFSPITYNFSKSYTSVSTANL